MRYTQEQTREIVGLSVETLRHWRHVVTYLRPKTGKAARYTFSDLISLSVVREVTNAGVPISGIVGGLDELFKLLSKTFWQNLRGKFIALSHNSAVIVSESNWHEVAEKGVTIIISCDIVLVRLQDELYPVIEIPSQRMLPFPPKAVKGNRQ
ncbi:MerR family transcriptional regulator [Geobacter hydrogenophilus]|uniref:HTH merR-type domain-containing protein n=1 Tax=Geobacter hydrogenophilus TaxID=40983 RepID=A0A9W6FZC9_9BACT|nr:MerR family transcriptional regulator [Geobacter hydrogenophilus]MBT0893751.1 MerR family transcriptional regulator [Geobacter hydrogenophilus]GLI37553.1 hypothetical protein GHYDROH2_10540 [Geobacter hydrogenophilus]